MRGQKAAGLRPLTDGNGKVVRYIGVETRNAIPLGERYEWCRKERERDAEIARKLAQIRAHIAHSTPQNGGSLPR